MAPRQGKRRAGVFLALALVVAGEAVVLWVDQLARHRRERAYWDIRAQRPELVRLGERARPMREPYRTLFEGYENHWLLGQYLWGDEPDWAGLANEERIEALSSGEKVLLGVAGGFAGDRTMRFADLASLDGAHILRVAQALLLSADR